jgi:selenium-binding protein 1
MATWTPDPTFYPSPRLATQAPPEKLAYVASFDPTRKRPDAMAVVDLNSESAGYGRIVGQTDLAIGDELHHFGWNACSSCLCPYAPHPHVERRYLIVPGIRSSRLHVLDTKPDPAHPKLIRTIGAEELAKRAGYSRPHTVHCGPEGIYVSALADAEGKHLGYDTMVTSEWGTPDMIEDGLIPEKILGSEYGHRLHFWDLLKRRHVQEIDLGKEYQLVFELRPAHDPTKAYGFAGVVLCLNDLSSSVFLWHRDGDRWGSHQGDLYPGGSSRPRSASSHTQKLQSLSTIGDGHRPLR